MMNRIHSNELKAVVITENLLDNPMNVLKENCLTVQHFDYLCEHKRNESDSVYGSTEPVILRFTIRVNSIRHAKPFYQGLIHNAHYNYSFLFNATYDGNGRLSQYEDGMVVDGYVTRVEESYNASKHLQGLDEQVQLNVELLIRSVVYLGQENNYTSIFIR